MYHYLVPLFINFWQIRKRPFPCYRATFPRSRELSCGKRLTNIDTHQGILFLTAIPHSPLYTAKRHPSQMSVCLAVFPAMQTTSTSQTIRIDRIIRLEHTKLPIQFLVTRGRINTRCIKKITEYLFR